MSTRKSQRRYFYHYLLILCCFTFCLSACIRVSGDITCEQFNGSGTIFISVFTIIEEEYNFIGKASISNPSNYIIPIPINYLNAQVYVSAVWDHDNNFYNTNQAQIGDYWNTYSWVPFQLEYENDNIDININQKITASISGVVTCDEYEDTGGGIKISAWDDESTTREH